MRHVLPLLLAVAAAFTALPRCARAGEPVVTPEIAKFHQDSFVMDLHTDTLLIIESLGYDFGKRHWAPWGFMPWMGHVDLPRAREGGLDAMFMGLVANPLWGDGRAQIRETLKFGHDNVLNRYPDQIELAWNAADLTDITHHGKIAVQFLLEGGHGLGKNAAEALPFLDELYQSGVRVIGLAHFSNNAFAASSASSNPENPHLTADGVAVIKRMNEMGIAIDLAHVHPDSFREIVNLSTSPVIVSHTGVAANKAVFRNVEDWQIKAVAKSGGVIGIMYAPHWLSSDMNTPIQTVVAHMKHVKDLVGAQYLALGSDYDGFIWLPSGMRDVTDQPKLTAAMLEGGFTRDEVKGILGENIVRVMKEIERRATKRPARASSGKH